MRKLFLLSFFIISVIAHARQISESEAAIIASEFFESISAQQNTPNPNVRRATGRNAENGGKAPFYVFNAEENNGFVIVSGDNRVPRILGYSDSGSFDFNNMPPQLTAILEQYAEQIRNLPAATPIHNSWKVPANIAYSEGGVLLETANWGQGAPYNSLCPIIDGVQAPTGCVATAMAIVMKYHNWPERGRKSHTNFFHPELSFDYENNPFNWDGMPLTSIAFASESDSHDVSKLMYACGTSIDTQYHLEGSGTLFGYISNAMCYYFNFAPNKTIDKKSYNDNDWNNLILNELNNERIVIYGGSGTVGHAFIVDGYDSNDNFHINWGWDGLYNGYYTLSDLTPGNDNYTSNQMMVIGIEPNYSNVRYSSFYINDGQILSSDFEDLPISTNDGLNFSCDKIMPNEPFSVIFPLFYGLNNQDGQITFAVVDDSQNIIEIVYPYGFNILDNYYPSFCHSVFINTCYPKYGFKYQTEKLAIKTDIKPGYRLQLIGRDNPDSDWEFIIDTSTISASVDLNSSVKSEWVNVKFDISGDQYIIPSSSYMDNNRALKNANVCPVLYHCDQEMEIDSRTNIYIAPSSFEPGKLSIPFEATNDVLFKATLIPNKNRFNKETISSSQAILDGVVYEIKDPEKKTARVIGFSTPEREDLRIEPEVSINGSIYTVTTIVPGAFVRNEYLESITLPPSIEEDMLAFGGTPNLKYITINFNELPYGHYPFLDSKTPYCFFDQSSNPNGSQWVDNAICSLGNSSSDTNWFVSDINNPIFFTYYLPCIEERDIHPNLFMPGGSHYNHEPKHKIVEMWSYAINKSTGKIEIIPQIADIVIDKVTINGDEIQGVNGIYSYDSDDSAPEVIVDYTLHNRQSMTTHYTPEFNTSLPDSDLGFISVSEISLNPSSVTGKEGDQIQLVATVLPENATNKILSWNSSNESVVTVDGEGLISLIKDGATVITASATDGSGVSAECAVIVAETTGIEDVLSDKTAYVKIFTLTGILVYEGIYSEANLAPDYYILVCEDKNVKVKVE